VRLHRYWLGGLLLLLAFVLSGTAFAQEVLLKDQSFVIEENGRPVGLKLNRLWRTDTGYQYIIDLNYQSVLPDGALVQTTKHLELQVDKTYYARSFNILTNYNGLITQNDGLFRDNQLTLTTISPDGQVKSTVYQLEDPVYFAGSLFDFLGANGQLKSGETFQMNIFNPDSLAFGEVSFNVEKGNYKYKNNSTASLAIIHADSPEPAAFVSGKGECYWENDPVLKVDFRKVSPAEFPEFKLRLAEYGVIPGKAKVPYPLRSQSSQIRLTLVNLKPGDYPLEDNRQKVSGRKTTGNRNELILAITRDDRDFTGKVTLPVKLKELAPYLAGSATDFIAPALPGVKKLAVEILGGEADGWRATQKLVNWVSAFIHPAVLPKTLKAGEIITQKAGSPAEYAVLFASIARSAGLPVRLASGMRFQDGIWVGYTWNEVWLGEWVAVDPSQNQVAPDAMLVKLTSGDSIPAIQKMRAAFTGNLGIDLMDVEIPEPEAAEINTMKTGVYGLTYWNAEYRCQIKAPEGWKLIETTEGGLPVLVAQPAANKDITGILTIFEIPEGATLEQYLQLHFPELQVDMAQYQLLTQQSVMGETKLIPAGGFNFNNNDLKFRQQNWLAASGNRGYLLVCLTPEEEWDHFENDFKILREQFTMIPDQPDIPDNFEPALPNN
jgi:hypothetical protein